MLGSKSDIPKFQAKLEVQQRYEFFTKFYLDHFSRSPITRPDSRHKRRRIEHNAHEVMVPPMMPRTAEFQGRGFLPAWPAIEPPSFDTLLCGPSFPRCPPQVNSCAPHQATESKPVEGLGPWRAARAPQSSAFGLRRPAGGRPPLGCSGGELHLLQLPPLRASERARACLLANTARPFKNGGPATHEQLRRY